MHASPRPVRARARLVAASLLLALTGGLLHATPAAAQAVPTLAAVATVADESRAGDTFTAAGECDTTADSTFTFAGAGTASGGDVQGTFTESGTVTLGPAPPAGSQPVTAFESSFTIQTVGGYTITGTKRLVSTRSGLCRPDGPTGRLLNFSADLEYEAAITGPAGFFSISGTARVTVTFATPGTSFPDGIAQLQGVFITSSPIVLGPASVVLNPPDAIEEVGTEHCVTATVRNVFGHPITSGAVRFVVSGASTVTGSAEISNGFAQFCYVGPSEPGTDTIRAFADANGDGVEDAGEPAAEATVIWNPVHRPPASLVLDPATASYPVGAEHCVTATVLDAIGAPSAGVRVRFTVLGEGRPSGSVPADAAGTAAFCYTGPSSPGTDTIRAYADTDDDGFHDTGEPFATATAVFEPVARPAVTLTLAPEAATRTVEAQHCVVATARDASGGPSDRVVVRFAVTGASDAGQSVTTESNGTAELCYTGPALPGTDAIRAFADTDGDGAEGGGEPAATASATWVLPASTAGCSATFGGRIDTGAGKATFAGTALTAGGDLRAQTEHQDHATGLTVNGDEVLAVVCDRSGGTATVYGRARLDSGAVTAYRLLATDLAEPGAGADTYRLLLGSGYDSRERVLEGGNVQVRVR